MCGCTYGRRAYVFTRGVIASWCSTSGSCISGTQRRIVRFAAWTGPSTLLRVERVAQSLASGLVASGGTDGVILLSDRNSGRFLRDLVGHFGGILSLAFHPAGDRLASSAQDGSVILWDVGGKPRWTFRAERPGETATSIVFDPTGASLFVGTSAGRLHRLDTENGRPIASGEPDTGRLASAFPPAAND